MMRIYLRVVLLMTQIFVLGGFAGPFLISYPSTEIVIFGVLFLVGWIPFGYWQTISILNLIEKETKNGKDEKII